MYIVQKQMHCEYKFTIPTTKMDEETYYSSDGSLFHTYRSFNCSFPGRRKSPNIQARTSPAAAAQGSTEEGGLRSSMQPRPSASTRGGILIVVNSFLSPSKTNSSCFGCQCPLVLDNLSLLSCSKVWSYSFRRGIGSDFARTLIA